MISSLWGRPSGLSSETSDCKVFPERMAASTISAARVPGHRRSLGGRQWPVVKVFLEADFHDRPAESVRQEFRPCPGALVTNGRENKAPRPTFDKVGKANRRTSGELSSCFVVAQQAEEIQGPRVRDASDARVLSQCPRRLDVASNRPEFNESRLYRCASLVEIRNFRGQVLAEAGSPRHWVEIPLPTRDALGTEITLLLRFGPKADERYSGDLDRLTGR